MKQILSILIACLLLVSCSSSNIPDPVRGSFATGCDISWLTEQEHDGVLFYDLNGHKSECIRLLATNGMNSVRLRVWVNHETGWCNKEDVVVKAKRAKALKQRIMIDFHYSDFFADPGKQNTPQAWTTYNVDEMCQAIKEHTTDVLETLQKSGVEPEWVQVGNETRNGMLWPSGQLWDDNGDTPKGWENYAAYTTAGYEAIKSVFPNAIVIVHIDNAYQNNNWFFRKLKSLGGQFDMIGLSHYPMMKAWSGKNWDEMNKLAAQNLKLLADEFKCKVMICEVGTLSDDEANALKAMEDFASKMYATDSCAGIFYWEPQVYNNWRPAEYIELGWGSYNMGAFTDEGQPNQALLKMLNINQISND